MFLWIALAGGCGGDVGISYYAESCSDWEFDEGEQEPELEVVVEGEEFLFRRVGVEMECNASFQPEIVAQHHLIQVFELWELPDDSEECTTCFTPTVAITDLRRGDYDLQWFEGQSSTLPLGALSLSLPLESE